MIDDHLLPRDLQRAIDESVTGVRFADLRSAAARLSEAYRTPDTDGSVSVRPWDRLAVLAYVATRMPATWAAARAVCQELRRRCPDVRVESLLDLGAGPGTTLWAAGRVFPELAHATLVEHDSAMAEMAARLLKDSSLDRRVTTTWRTRPPDTAHDAASQDLVVVGYLLTEGDAGWRRATLDVAWRSCNRAVVVIVPGSPSGFRVMLEARQQLLAHGATIVAPCPHADDCPLPNDDWCHFAARVNRSSIHRRLKGGRLSYEDEKFAYVIATRAAGTPAPSRVLQRPRPGHRRVTLELCTVDGLRSTTVPRSAREIYRAARNARWGDAWE